MKRRITIYILFYLSIIFFIGCESKNKNTQNIEIKPKNKIGEILKLETMLDYTKVTIRTKIYEETIFYQVDLKYVPKILEVPDEKEPNKKIKKDLSQVTLKNG